MMNGMLQEPPPQAPVPQAPAPQGGMLGAQQPQESREGKGYTGVITIDGDEVQVTGGVLDDDGDTYYVSDDGLMVFDEERDIIGYIENGAFKELTDEHIELLRSKGYLE